MLKPSLNANLIEAGCDEAGRGCLAGPVIAAAVILPPNFTHPLLKDSKQLSEKNRYLIRDIILTNAISYAIELCTVAEIAKYNILWASVKAMHKCVANLSVIPQHLAVDGNRFKPFLTIPHTTIVKGDSLYLHIAAASILAKTSRDNHMLKLHDSFPMYGWNNNKGYPTIAHRNAIAKYGPCKHHRMGFKLLPNQLTLF